MTDIRTRSCRGLSPVIRSAVLSLVCFSLLLSVNAACADTVPTLFSSFAGNMNFIGTAQTLRTQPDGTDSCAVTTGTTTATLSGMPSGATVNAAYLYWAGSSSNITSAPDYDVIFDGSAVSAATGRRYTATHNLSGTNLFYFSGVADVTAAVSVKGNGSYSFSGLTVNTGAPQCASSATLAGWALVVIYSHAPEDFRVINVFEGFQAYRGTSITLTPNNFKIPVSPINGRHAYITWEGDVGNSAPLNGFSEGLVFNGTVLSNASNPSANQFNSVSTIGSPVNTASYGIDFDVYDISPYLSAGQTMATSVYSSGGDLVLLSSEIISVTNTPVADISLVKTRNTPLSPGQNATYTLTVTNNGPNAEPGPVTVTDTLPGGLSFSSASGSGWSCSAAGQTVTCTRAGSLGSGSSDAVTLTVAVAANVSGSKTNTATVAGTAFDNQSANDSSSDTYAITADLAIAITRDTSHAQDDLVPGQSANYVIDVTNDGPSTEAGPVTVTDTLPAGLTYVSGTGSGWSCSAVGQEVICTRSGSLPAGTTSTLTLTVAVAANASGAISNTATVAGTPGLDANAANNSDSDSFVFSPFAYYAMDESSWGTVTDASGNGRNGTRLGTTSPTGFPTLNPPGSAIAGSPGTCGSGSIPASGSAGAQGINTGIDVHTLNVATTIGNAGTIAFWYRSNIAWDDGTDRMLFDASADLGNNNADKHFYLVKRGDGSLMFALEDSADDNSTATTADFTFAANTWHHIAVTWDLAADRLFIYVDGNTTPAATSTTSLGTLGNLGVLLLGTRVGGTVSGTAGDYTANSANGSIDEVYIYNTAITGTGVATLKNLTHPCTAAIHHYELSLPTSSITCMPTAVTVKACADSSSPCTSLFTGVNGQTANLTASGGGTLGASTVVFDAAGVATTTLSFTTAADGTPVSVRLSAESTPATNLRQCCPDGVSCTVANSCFTTFNTAGFIFSSSATGGVATIPSQVAGLSSNTLYLRAVQSNTATGANPANTAACQAALTGPQSVNFGYQCNNPITCTGSNLMTVNGGTSTTIARNDNASVTSYLPVNLSFDANGAAPLTFNYSDVGQVTLRVSKAVNGATLTGASNPFVVKPYGFTLSGIQQTASPNLTNPAAASVLDSNAFVRAGEDFSLTVTAINAQAAATPNYGRESGVPEGVQLAHALVLPADRVQGALTGNFGSFGDGVPSGVATGNAFTWNEVGVITIAPSVGDGNYLGAGDVGTIGSMTAGSNVLTVASTTGIAIGTNLIVMGAGANGNNLAGTVTAVSGNSIVVHLRAATTVSGARVLPSTGNVGRFFPHHFGLTGNVVPRSDLPRTTGSMAFGGTVLTVASAAGIAVNSNLVVLGAGQQGTPLQATVVGVAGNTVTLSASAAIGVVNANVYIVTQLNGSIASGSTTLIMAATTGIALNNVLVVLGAGQGGAPLQAKVTAVAGNNITLAAPAATTVVNARIYSVNIQDDFTYMGEPMLLQLQVTAHNAADGVTQNYTGNFARLSASAMGTGANWFNAGCTGTAECFGLGAIDAATGTALTSRLGIDATRGRASSWNAGIGTFSAHVILGLPATTTPNATWGPYETLRFGGVPRDRDGVTVPGPASADTTHRVDLSADGIAGDERRLIFQTKSRRGRIRLSNAHGSELLPLPIGVTTQYWSGAAFVTNTLDNNTRFLPTPGNIDLSNPQKNLALAETSVTMPPNQILFNGGIAGYTLARPNGGDGKYDGSVDMAVNTNVLPYLLRNRARATFGVYKGNNQFIYTRENY